MRAFPLVPDRDYSVDGIDDIRDVNIFPLQSDRGKELVEKLACRTDKRPSKLIFFRSRRLADEDNLCVWIPFAKNRVRMRRKRTSFPILELITQEIEAERHGEKCITPSLISCPKKFPKIHQNSLSPSSATHRLTRRVSGDSFGCIPWRVQVLHEAFSS